MLKKLKMKLRRLLATIISALLVISVAIPVEAKAQETPNDPIPLSEYLADTYSYAYGGLLDLRLLNGVACGKVKYPTLRLGEAP